MTFKKKHEEEEAPVKHSKAKHADEEVVNTSEAPADEALEPAVAFSAPKPKMLKVKKTAKASWNGQEVIMHAGDVIEAGSYGPQGIERFQEQGVEFEET